MRRALALALVLAWLTAAVALTLSTQRPLPAAVVQGLARTGAALLVAGGLVFLAHTLGRAWRLPSPGHPWLAVAWQAAAGVWFLSVLTLALGVAGWARPGVLRGLAAAGWLVALGFWGNRLRVGRPRAPRRAAAPGPGRGWALAMGLPALLLALAPPSGFDALLYHLRQPEWLLQHGKLQPYPVYPFWHPGLLQGLYAWALAWRVDRAAQLLSLAYAAAALLLAWWWARQAFGPRTAAWVWPLAASMASGLLLAAGAYVDWPLAFHATAALYAVGRARQEPNPTPWWRAVGFFTGLAMATKYTALPVPLTVGLLALLTGPGPWRDRAARTARLGLLALAVAAPWYARNAYYMGNPVYPFVFGGYGWDAFRAQWLAEPGTGIGWQWREWLLLPWNLTLGHRDAAYYHGRIGPLWLALAPLAIAAAWRRWRRGPQRQRALLQITGLFGLLSGGLWAWGVARSQALWQARLLWPALVAALPWWAHALRWARSLDLPGVLRWRYIVRWVVWGVAGLTVLEWLVFAAARHPLAYTLGLETRADYYRRALPDYQDMADLVAQTPADARVFMFFEPRSYGLPRETLPDAILDHWAWYLHRYGSPQAVARALTCAGWTHALVYTWGADFVHEERPAKFPPRDWAAWQAFLGLLEPAGSQGNYTLYRLPGANTYNCTPGPGPK